MSYIKIIIKATLRGNSTRKRFIVVTFRSGDTLLMNEKEKAKALEMQKMNLN